MGLADTMRCLKGAEGGGLQSAEADNLGSKGREEEIRREERKENERKRRQERGV